MASEANPVLLDKFGLGLALAMGAAVLVFGQSYFIWIFLLFLALSVLVTKYGFAKKREIGLYEHERSWENVLANGIIPVCAAIGHVYFGWGAYVGSVAAIASDKFASELGVLSEEPISLLTFKKAKRGESGCVSWFGTLMSLNGSLLIGVGYWFLVPGQSLWIILQIGAVGFAGSVADSLVGVLEEKGYGNKATTNMICAAVGAILGMAFLGK